MNALPPNSRASPNLHVPLLHAFNSLALIPWAVDLLALALLALASVALVCVYERVRILVLELC